ncbi:protein FAR1-RELATED SEQUENCE 3-like [Cryptomeria japonica]|uniref:protein FAR1-RELATED SEQUENCE 3-like n=1 Tax=Cryptomeria japonica TaxID=3369 RepID=UPI0027D9FB21|nr:protein FAR1-RELATED SEQUENCE 3-like [Cryptomeria japonica]
MAKDQLEWPRTRVVYQVKVGPTVPQTSPANMVLPVWPRLEDNRRPFNHCELGVPLGMPFGNLNSSRLVPQQPPQDDINGDSSLVSLPRLKAMTWSMENQNSTPANRVAVINLKLQDYTKPSSGETEIKFPLSRDTLEAMLRSMYYIRDQLSNAAAAPSGPVLKKPRQ